MQVGRQVFEQEANPLQNLGGVQDLAFQSQLEVDRKTLAPSSFACTQKSDDGAFKVNCVYSPTMVAQRNHVGKMEQTHFHHYETEVPRLVFNNLWGHLDTFAEHYWLLVRSAANGGALSAYAPIPRGAGAVAGRCAGAQAASATSATSATRAGAGVTRENGGRMSAKLTPPRGAGESTDVVAPYVSRCHLRATAPSRPLSHVSSGSRFLVPSCPDRVPGPQPLTAIRAHRAPGADPPSCIPTRA